MKKQIYSRQILFLSIMAFTIATMCLLSCEKETTNKCENSQEGVLRNLTGLDGCGWIIQLTDSTKLEPINLEDFNVELVENKSVCIQYVERIDLGSYCMVGKVVEIVFLE
jgi:hypothetical protein